LQKAFLAVHKDPRYLADAAALKVDVSPIGGDAASHLIERLAATPSDQRAELKTLLSHSP
jgi:hypothetical protein